MSVESITTVQKSGTNGIQIHVPAIVRTDSKNPIRLGEKVIVRVDGKQMVIVPAHAKQDAEGTEQIRVDDDVGGI